MADTLKVLGQLAPLATTLTDLYTVPAATSTAVSTLVVCNRSAAATFRVSVAVGGAVDATKQYLFFDTPIGAGETRIATSGFSLAATDVVRCYGSTANLSFSLFGVEIT